MQKRSENMAGVELGDIVLPGIVTLFACYQLAEFAKSVGELRRKYKISPPECNGPPEFMRGMRAQQNCQEFFNIFMWTMWISSVFFHPGAVAGLVYLYSRNQYFTGYIESADGRLPGFKLGVKCLYALLGMSAIGLSHCFLQHYLGINVRSIVGF